MTINWPEKFARKGHEIFLSGLPIALHCHHYNMNLQKEESSYVGFTSFLRHHPKISTIKSKL
jgi:hypothetical protein